MLLESRGAQIIFPGVRDVWAAAHRLNSDSKVAVEAAVEILGLALAVGPQRAVKTLERLGEDQATDEAGIDEAHEIEMEARRRLADTPAWGVAEGEVLPYHISRRESLEEVIAEEVQHFRPGERDRAVWRGRELLAVIRDGPDGKPVVTRFDT